MTNEHRSAPQARSLAFRLPCCFGGFVRAVVILSASPMPRLAMRAASRFFRARKPFVSALSARLFENAHVKFDLHTFVRLIVVSNAIRLSQSPKRRVPVAVGHGALAPRALPHLKLPWTQSFGSC